MNAVQYDRPDLEEVLRDIAKSPKSKLLRVPKARDVVRAMRDEPVGVAAAGLTSAERHLLQVHREEVAYLLRERCVMELFQTPESVELDRHGVRGHTTPLVTEEDWTNRSQSWARRAAGFPEMGSTLDLIDRCISETEETPSVGQLAVASLRCAWSDKPPIYEALDLARLHRHQDAIEVCRALLKRPSMSIFPYVWTTLGRSFALQGDPRKASESYNRACTSPIQINTAPLCWLGQAVLAVDRSGAQVALAIVDQRLRADQPSATQAIEYFRHRTRAPRGALDLARDLLDEAGDVSTRILHAFLRE